MRAEAVGDSAQSIALKQEVGNSSLPSPFFWTALYKNTTSSRLKWSQTQVEIVMRSLGVGVEEKSERANFKEVERWSK